MQKLDHEPTIKLLDKSDNLIKFVSFLQAVHLLRNDYAQFVPHDDLRIQFLFDEWNDSFLEKKKSSNFIIKKTYYGNYLVLSQEGQEMFLTSPERILWYLNRNLIEFVSGKKFKLKFKPNGMGHSDDSYYLAEKRTQCVVCGLNEDLTRHHVVPHAFIKYLDVELKEHRYHDVLLTCISCHKKYEQESYAFKSQLCKKFGFDEDDYRRKQRIRRIANAVYQYDYKIPENKLKPLLQEISVYLRKSNICREDIQQVRNIKLDNKERFIVERIDDLQLFVEDWRNHFVQTMNPQFLPEHWNVKKSV